MLKAFCFEGVMFIDESPLKIDAAVERDVKPVDQMQIDLRHGRDAIL